MSYTLAGTSVELPEDLTSPLGVEALSRVWPGASDLAVPYIVRGAEMLSPAWVTETICACLSYGGGLSQFIPEAQIRELLVWVSTDPVTRCNALCTVRRLGGDVTKLLESV